MQPPLILTLFLLAIGTSTGLSASVDSLLRELLQGVHNKRHGGPAPPPPPPPPPNCPPPPQTGFTLLYAGCDIQPDNMDISGSINLRQQTDGKLDIFVDVTGFDNTDDYSVHGLHVHQYADFSDGCSSFGGHYNPDGTNHGAPYNSTAARHLGDWGNIAEDNDGNIQFTTQDWDAKLEGLNNIAGHGIVIHATKDDLGQGGDDGSLATGNAGSRLGCCVIYYNDGSVWQDISTE